jgi:hypothetical protein
MNRAKKAFVGKSKQREIAAVKLRPRQRPVSASTRFLFLAFMRATRNRSLTMLSCARCTIARSKTRSAVQSAHQANRCPSVAANDLRPIRRTARFRRSNSTNGHQSSLSHIRRAQSPIHARQQWKRSLRQRLPTLRGHTRAEEKPAQRHSTIRCHARGTNATSDAR